MFDKTPHRVHHSAVDWWIALMLMLGPVICVGVTGILIWEGRQQDALYCLITTAGVLLVTAAFTMPCRYTILPDSLSIRCGLIMMRIPLAQIKSMEKSASWLSGPALSLRRVKIKTASRFYLVSPKDRDRFMEELSAAVEAARVNDPSAGKESAED